MKNNIENRKKGEIKVSHIFSPISQCVTRMGKIFSKKGRFSFPRLRENCLKKLEVYSSITVLVVSFFVEGYRKKKSSVRDNNKFE